MRSALLAVLAGLFAGCNAQAPAHTDAWLSIKYGLGCGLACPGMSDAVEANNYNIAIGIGDTLTNSGPRPVNLGQWKQTFGYPGNTLSGRAIYGNQLDLQFGRDMNCWDFGQGGVACYVANYGPQPGAGAGWPDLRSAFDDAIKQHNPFAVVAMAYDPSGIGTNGDKITFAAFSVNDPSNIDTSVPGVFAALDEENGKSIPRMCMACHGGTYDTSKHSVKGASFLPFDVWSFYYDSKITAGPYDMSLQEEFRKLNALVLKTNPNQPIVDLVNGLYALGYGLSVNDTGATIVTDEYIPDGWKTPDFNGQKLYKGVFRRYCRMCHMASQALPFSTYAQFQTAAPQIQKFVTCGPSSTVKQSHDMPHAEVPFGGLAGSTNFFGPGQGFWMDSLAQDDLNKFLASQNASCN